MNIDKKTVESFPPGLWLVGEYLGARPETVNYQRDGKAMKFSQILHTVFFRDKSVVLAERLPDGYHPTKADYKAPFERGARVVAEIESVSREKGFEIVTGQWVVTSQGRDVAAPATARA